MKTRIVTALFALAVVAHIAAFGQGPPRSATIGSAEPRGLRLKTDKASPGYTLFAPLSSDTALRTG